jgi:hypothetical protein
MKYDECGKSSAALYYKGSTTGVERTVSAKNGVDPGNAKGPEVGPISPPTAACPQPLQPSRPFSELLGEEEGQRPFLLHREQKVTTTNDDC